MPLLEIDRNPSRRDLRIFAWLLPVFFAVVGGLRWAAGSPRAAAAIGIVGLAVSAVAVVVPPARRWLYLGWMYASYPIAWVVSHLLLIAIYALVVTPTAWLLRALGRDPMRRRFDASVDSYWIAREPAGDPDRASARSSARASARGPARYFRQY